MKSIHKVPTEIQINAYLESTGLDSAQLESILRPSFRDEEFNLTDKGEGKKASDIVLCLTGSIIKAPAKIRKREAAIKQILEFCPACGRKEYSSIEIPGTQKYLKVCKNCDSIRLDTSPRQNTGPM